MIQHRRNKAKIDDFFKNSKNQLILVLVCITKNNFAWGVVSLVDGIRGCSKVLWCFFVIFDFWYIDMGGFPFHVPDTMRPISNL